MVEPDIGSVVERVEAVVELGSIALSTALVCCPVVELSPQTVVDFERHHSVAEVFSSPVPLR